MPEASTPSGLIVTVTGVGAWYWGTVALSTAVVPPCPSTPANQKLAAEPPGGIVNCTLAAPTVAAFGARTRRLASDDCTVTTAPPAGAAAPRKRVACRISPAPTFGPMLNVVVGGGLTVTRALSMSKLVDDTIR